MQQQSETRWYRIGGLVIELTAPPFEEREYLAPFRVPDTEPDARYEVTLREEISPPEGTPVHEELYEAIYRRGDTRCRVLRNERTGGILMTDAWEDSSFHRVEYDRRYPEWFGSNLVMKILDLPRQMLHWGGLFLHASFIEVHRKAILFTAPKQTGKSTQAELWRVHRGARVVNGDRALLRRIGGVWHACGSPYCGTSRICMADELPVRAVVCLRQSATNEAGPAGTRQALAALLDGCSYDTWDGEAVEKMLSLAEGIIGEVPFVNLACTPDERAVKALEEVL